MTTEIIFTALPNGRDENGSLRLSVHITPRLTTGGDDALLEDFPVFLGWPPTDLTFSVEFNGHPGVKAQVVSQPDVQLWEALFGPDSLVRSQEFGSPGLDDFSSDPVHTYPMAKITQWLKDRYSQVAITSPDDGPGLDTLIGDLGFEDLMFTGLRNRERWQAASQWLHDRLLADGVVDTRLDPPSPTRDFFQLKDFFAPLEGDQDEVDAVFDADVRPPTLDFHAAVKFCGQHPTLMRLLGLVFDLRVSDEQGLIVPGTGKVRVVPASASLAATVVRTPWTHSSLTDATFEALPRVTSGMNHLLSDGFLRLDDTTQFVPVVIDAQGGGLKAVDFAGNLGSRAERPSEGSPTRFRLPSLRSDGLAVALKGNAKLLKEALERSAQQIADLAAGQLEVHAEDVVRGFRIDVWDDRSETWRSLMRRQGHYEIGGTHVIPVQDEAFLTETTTRKPRRRALYQPETLFGWDGWSLAVERPGRTHNTDPQGPPLIDQPEGPPTDFDARFDFGIVPGSLPSLRFGTHYRFRARTVDLAGNSLPAESDDDSHATPRMLFGRFEPPQTPPVVLRVPRGPGESMEVVALRSNLGIQPDPPTAERHVTPPRVSQRTLELHGSLDVADPDGAAGLVLDKAAYDELAERDTAHLFNHPDGAEDPADRVDPEGARFYDVDQLDTTWIPDPGAAGFALRLLDGPHAGFLTVNLFADSSPTHSWTDNQCVRLVVVEGDAEPVFDAATRVLSVPLRKGDLVHARLSSVVSLEDLHRFGMWSWIEDAGPPAAVLDELRSLIRRGQHWMFEPFRVLTLVHAVRQPLLPPEFPDGLSAGRSIGDTYAMIGRTMHFSRRSTSKVDVLATWREPVDGGPGADAPVAAGHPGSVQVDDQNAFVIRIVHDDDLDPEIENFLERHEFGDTRHRLVTYRGVATSRYAEFFTERDELAYDPNEASVVLDTGGMGVVPGSVKITHHPPPPNPDDEAGPQHLVEGEDGHFTLIPSSGTITFDHDAMEALDSPPQAGDPIVVVFAVPPVTRETPDPPSEAEGETGPVRLDVPSSARPDAPRVRYVLPTFGWESGEVVADRTVVGVSSTRRGNGVRIYLDRPWWSSGEGELLGVVTWPNAELPDPGDLDSHPESAEDLRRPFVTEWGEDPVYAGVALPSRYPKLESFPRAIDAGTTATGLTLEELTGSKAASHLHVNVAGHPVEYDLERDLWFCDVEVDAGSAYNPFIRFALARYQPSSIPDAHLSRVVLADFVQLAPDRFATVVIDEQPDATVGLRITLSGPTHRATEATGGDRHPGTAHAIFERKNPAIPGQLGWEQVAPPVPLDPSLARGGGRWYAETMLPGPYAEGTWRLVIEQFEFLHSADPVSRSVKSTPRLVHTDIVHL